MNLTMDKPLPFINIPKSMDAEFTDGCWKKTTSGTMIRCPQCSTKTVIEPPPVSNVLVHRCRHCGFGPRRFVLEEYR